MSGKERESTTWGLCRVYQLSTVELIIASQQKAVMQEWKNLRILDGDRVFSLVGIEV